MTITETIAINRAADPSRSIALRNAFARAMRNRFGAFNKIVTEVIVDDNVFGIVVNRKPGQGAFAFPSAKDKLNAFTAWMEQQMVDDILQVTRSETAADSVDAAWPNKYIQEAYKRGVIRARNQIRGRALPDRDVAEVIVMARRRRSRIRIPSLSETGGIGSVLMTPGHIDTLGLLYTRVFNELKGITEAMAQQIGRVLAQGLASGLSSDTIARQIRQVITGIGEDLSITDSLGRHIPAARRAMLMARTEIIRAHAEAQLQEFENWGIHGVTAKAELLTAQDQRVCLRCIILEKRVMTIDEARGLIPVHPACRCIWVPFIQ